MINPPVSNKTLVLMVPLVTDLRIEPYLPIPIESLPLSVLATKPPIRALLATISASTYAFATLPLQISPAIPAKYCPLSPIPVSLPMKATFVN